ncbi:MAG: hypothetical protein AAF641_03985 [Pseudomonadota bacterium]
MTEEHGKFAGPGVRRVDTRYFLIVLVPIAVFVMEAVISDHLMAEDVQVPTGILSADNHWLEAAGRYRFLASTWFFAALTVLAVWILVRRLLQPTTRQTRVVALMTWLVVVALALSPTIMNAFGDGGSPAYRVLGKTFFEAALAQGTVPGCAAPGDHWLLGRCGDMPAISLFERIMDVINLLAGLAVGALIVGMILCLDTRRCEDAEEEAALLAENLRLMRQQLYLASLVLTFGMFFVTSWMNWPVPVILDAQKAAYGSLVLSAALFSGTFFTLLLLSFYLPVAFILSERARRLSRQVAGRRADALVVQDWMATHGLKDGLGDYLRAGFALTAPILSAFAGGVAPFPI